MVSSQMGPLFYKENRGCSVGSMTTTVSLERSYVYILVRGTNLKGLFFQVLGLLFILDWTRKERFE